MDKLILSELTNGLNTVWMLLAAMLVFFMQPGFALVEAGFTRVKNTANILMKNFVDFMFGSPLSVRRCNVIHLSTAPKTATAKTILYIDTLHEDMIPERSYSHYEVNLFKSKPVKGCQHSIQGCSIPDNHADPQLHSDRCIGK